LRSNTFEMEWPPQSGKMKEFPEVDRAEFFSVEAAREKMYPAEFEFLERLVAILGSQRAGDRRPNRRVRSSH
jgi:predicted NUDIX family NTP pyrophosphohydrolase